MSTWDLAINEAARTVLPWVSTVLVGIVAWIGRGMNQRLDRIAETLHVMEVSWTQKLTHLDGRVTQLETLVHLYHPRGVLSHGQENAAAP